MILIDPISPVAFSIFGFDIRWYALAYIAAFVIGFWMFRRMVSSKGSVASHPACGGSDRKSVKGGENTTITLSKKQFEDLFTAVILGVIIGGRLGYVLFYNLSFFIAHPLEILAVWHGGMSFHGGMIGTIVAILLFARKNNEHGSPARYALSIMDVAAVCAPIGLFFGRIANFINMEVMGRVTDKPWGVVFNGTGDVAPRHPSPLYEAALEGVLLFVIMFCLWKFTKLKKYPGALSGMAAMLYAVFRIFCEQFRAPDAQIGFLTSWGLTMGQLLSGLMFAAGLVVFLVVIRKK